MRSIFFSMLLAVNSFKPLNMGYKKSITPADINKPKTIEIQYLGNWTVNNKNGVRDTRLFVKNNDQEDDNNDNSDNNDIVVKFAEFMGFGPKEKWKAVRYTVYAFTIGYLGSELGRQILEDFSNPFKDIV